MAVRKRFLVSVFTSTSNKQTRQQVKQAAVERSIEQRRMPDKIIDPGWDQHAAHQPEDRQWQKQFKKNRWERQTEHHDNGKQTHVDLD